MDSIGEKYDSIRIYSLSGRGGDRNRYFGAPADLAANGHPVFVAEI